MKSTEPWQELATFQEHQIVLSEIRRLPSKYREVIVLCCVDERSRRQTADRLNSTEATIKGLLARGRSILQRRLVRRGIAPAVALAFCQSSDCFGGCHAANPDLIESTLELFNDSVNETASSIQDLTLESTPQIVAAQCLQQMVIASIAIRAAVCTLLVALVAIPVTVAAQIDTQAIEPDGIIPINAQFFASQQVSGNANQSELVTQADGHLPLIPEANASNSFDGILVGEKESKSIDQDIEGLDRKSLLRRGLSHWALYQHVYSPDEVGGVPEDEKAIAELENAYTFLRSALTDIPKNEIDGEVVSAWREYSKVLLVKGSLDEAIDQIECLVEDLNQPHPSLSSLPAPEYAVQVQLVEDWQNLKSFRAPTRTIIAETNARMIEEGVITEARQDRLHKLWATTKTWRRSTGNSEILHWAFSSFSQKSRLELEVAGSVQERKRIVDKHLRCCRWLVDHSLSYEESVWISGRIFVFSESLVKSEHDAAAEQFRDLSEKAISRAKSYLTLNPQKYSNQEHSLRGVHWQMAMISRARGNFALALKIITDELQIKNDHLKLQVAAAETLQEWGNATADRQKLTEAIAGKEVPVASVDKETPLAGGASLAIWGWRKIAKATEANPSYKETNHRAIFKICQIRFEYGVLVQDLKALDSATRQITIELRKTEAKALTKEWRQKFADLSEEVERAKNDIGKPSKVNSPRR